MASVVYFAEIDGNIKIGCSTQLKTRVHRLGHGAVVKLIGAVPGTVRLEKSLHGELAEYALGGEMFEDTTAVRAVINDVMRGGGKWGDEALSLTDNDESNRGWSVDEAKYVQIAADCADAVLTRHITSSPHMTVGAAMAQAAAHIGVSYQTFWKLRYRPPKTITAGEYGALVDAAQRVPEAGRAAEALVGETAGNPKSNQRTPETE